MNGEPADPQGTAGRRSKIASGLHADGATGVAIAVVSTVIVVALVAAAIVRSPNWPEVKEAFFNWDVFVESLPEIAAKFIRNIEYFMIAEAFILVWALVLAILRGLPGPVFFPFRLFAIVYTDVFRGVPTILVIYLLGFGVPSLQLPGVPNSATFWAVIALILSYSAYVAEVYRAGIESVHPSQSAASRSLGLSRGQTLRHVVAPQAVRRVIPPLLNDFIGLQKDTALVSVVVVVPEALKQTQIIVSADFNFTPFLAAALLFLLVTIPLTRFVDYLLARQRRRRESGAIV